VNDFMGGIEPVGKPVFWYGLPHGYRQLDIRPAVEGLGEVAEQIRRLPEELCDQANQVFRLYAGVVLMLGKQQVQGCALGVHPDGDGGLVLSVLVVSAVAMPGTNPKAVLTAMLAEGGEDGVRPVELPVGPGFLSELVRDAVAPGGQEEPVWQGMVAVPDTRTSSVVALQLVTGSVRLADDYRGILLGVARTLTFTNPEQRGGPGDFTSAAVGHAEEAMRSDFG
jgi:hypothetical protein